MKITRRTNKESKRLPPKKRAMILVISAIVALVVLLILNSIDFDALANRISEDKNKEETQVQLFPDYCYPDKEDINFEEDITLDQKYMERDVYVRLKIGNEENQLVGDTYEKGTLEHFWVGYFDALRTGDTERLNGMYSEDFIVKNGKFKEIAPQKVYNISVELVSSVKITEGKYAGVDRYVARVAYNIQDNNGTFRRDVKSDESKEQYFEILDGGFGMEINSVTYPKDYVPSDNNKGGISIMTFVWIALIIISVVVEMLTVSLVAIWFMPAGLVALVLSLLGVNVSVQILVYLACAGITLILAKTLLKNKIFPKKEATNADRIIGMQARVTEKIDPSGEIGEVKVDGKRWSAKMNDGGGAEEGDVVTIVRIQGVTVYCERSQTKVDD